MIRSILLSLILVFSFSLARPQDNDPHAGQPDRCNNYHETKSTDPRHCECNHTMCDSDGESNKQVHPSNNCKTYCRTEACDCGSECDT
jgi:hypothetical protein